MRKLLCVVASLLMAMPIWSVDNDWKSYLSYHNVTYSFPVGDKIYAVAGGALFSYKPGDTTVKTYSKFSGLSGTNITHAVFCEELAEIVLVYEDYNIDIVSVNDSIINIPQYKNSSFADKTINNLTIVDSEALLSTNFGLVVINLKKAEFVNAYEIGTMVRAAVTDGDRFVLRVTDGIMVGDRTKNLLDRSNWTLQSSSKPQYFIPFNNRYYAMYGDGLYSFDTETLNISLKCKGTFSSFNPYGDKLVLQSKTKIAFVDADDQATVYDIANDFVALCSEGTRLWASRNNKGLQAFTIDSDTLKAVSNPIIPDSPIRNYFSEISFTPSGRLLVAGGALAYSGKTSYEGTVMAFEDGHWINFSEDSIKAKTGINFLNVTSVAQDPQDPTHHFASSSEGGLYEFRNYRFHKLFNCDNSPLKSILPNSANYLRYNRVCGAKYDDKGNLWMFNNQVDTIVRVLTPDMQWKGFYFDEIDGYPTFDNFVFEKNGRVWMTHRRWAGTFSAGIACLDYNGTLDNKADDKFVFCKTFTNQNGTTATISLLYTAVFDQNGQLWIGTDQGVFVLEDPSKIFSGSVVFRQPVIPRNDGTNYADYLLDGVPVKCIVVDGANRKWIGTTNNGLYLVSADGLEIIAHYTTENSPLISDCILSLAINSDNGLVMIGTDLGLLSYRGDATTPAETLKENNIKVFPNPVRPEYTGRIRVTGFTSDSDVKITTVSGQVVAQGTSLGGTFNWNGRDSQGKRVATGIYYVIGSDAEGKNGIVAKILIVK